MDANIKTAASLLRNASSNLQYRIRELQSDETNTQHRENQEERNIRSDMLQTEIRLAHDNGGGGNTQYLVRHLLDLRKRRNQVKDEADKKVRAEKVEIRSLQAQINKLNDIARMLEMWR